jgi:hypothetical protein
VTLILTRVAEISSIIGLVLTIFTLRKVLKLEEYYIRKARLPKQLTSLLEMKNDLYKLLGSYTDNEDKIKEILIRSRSVLTSLSQKVDTKNKKRIEEKLRNNIIEGVITLDKARAFYDVLIEIISDMNEYMGDNEWRTNK